MAYANQSKNTASYTLPNVSGFDFSDILMESGDVILMESGDKILMELASTQTQTYTNQSKNTASYSNQTRNT